MKYLNSIQQKESQIEQLKYEMADELSTPEQNLKVEGNNIYIYTVIDDKSLLFLRTSIDKLILNYKQTQMIYSGINAQSLNINIYIASNGGDLFSGFSMYDIIKNCPYTVNTYVQGFAASAATLPFLAGKNRFMTQNGFILIHQYSTWVCGTFKNIKDQVQSGDKFMNKLRNLYLSNLSITQKQLDVLLQSDLWLTYQQALQFGFIKN